MRNALIHGMAALVLAAAGPTLAASPAVNVPLAPTFNWSGPYVGINGGYAWGNSGYSFIPGGSGDIVGMFAPDDTGGSFSHNPSGGLVGGQLGFNQQWGPLVLGLEASFDWSNASATSSNVLSTFNSPVSYETRLRWLTALTPRVGYAWDNWLVYAKAGLAVGQIASSLSAPSYEPAEGFGDNHAQIGWTAGVGVDLAMWQHWIFSLEYDYYGLGTQRFGGEPNPNTTFPVDYTVRSNFSAVLARMSFKIGGPDGGAATTMANPFIGFSGPWNAPTTWTGPYIGLNGGYGWGNAGYSFQPGGAGGSEDDGVFAPYDGGAFTQNGSGGVGGIHAGFNRQWSNFVAGLEGSIDWSTISATSTNSLAVPFPPVSYQTKIHWLATITPRLGFAWDNLLFYVKGGLAAAEVTSSMNAPGSDWGPESFSTTHDFLGWTVGVGAEMAVWQNLVVGLEYNTYHLNSQRFGGEPSPNTTWPVDYTVRPTFGTVLARISWKFGSAPLPPAPAPAPVAAPAPAPARSYLVFFDWDKATLTARAQQIIKEAADNSTKVQYTRIEVNGYTDTSGTPQYNQGLSVRRAQAVAAELVKDGVPQGAIAIQGFGETHLLVPTGPGVREPQNRRVEIIIR